MWVIKIGGSLLGSVELPHLLALIAMYGNGQVVIVPGGGVFAEAVRDAQRQTNISDAAAHQLAILAMDQFGHLLAAMSLNLVTASSELEISEYSSQHKGIIWLPSKMTLAEADIPQNWQLTSDSLSAWLANKLGAQQLVLVKSKSLSTYEKSTSVKTLIEDELVDSEFPAIAVGKSYSSWVLNKADYAVFDSGFHEEKLTKKAKLIKMLS